MNPDKHVLIMGAGTVGTRDADILRSLGYRVSLAKRTVNPGEIRTEELREIKNRYNGDIDVFIGDGPNLEERKAGFKRIGINTAGFMRDFDYGSVDLIIDAVDDKEGVRENVSTIYRPNGLPFIINGGAPSDLVDSNYFAGVPGTTASNGVFDINKNAKIISCNSHAMTTAIMLAYDALSDLGFGYALKSIGVTLMRRSKDPHQGLISKIQEIGTTGVSLERKPYHVDEIEAMFPNIAGRIETKVGKWPVEYFHTLIFDFQFDDDVPRSIAEKFEQRIADYPWTILANGEIVDHEKVIDAAAKAGIEDGDIPFPVYSVCKPTDNQRFWDSRLTVFGLTPQRGIVAPSTAVYTVMKTLGMKFEEAFNYVNENGSFRGKPLNEIAEEVQKYL